MNIQKIAIDLGNGGLKGAIVRDRFADLAPSTLPDLETYLGSLDGVSPALAKKIVATFGVATVTIIESEPTQLQQVGASPAQAAALRETWISQRPARLHVTTAYLPAKVGVGDTNLGALSLGGLEKRGRDEKPIQIVSDEGAYLVGHNVERYAPLLERFDASKYAEAPELRAVTRALLAQIVDGGESDVALVVALPVGVMMSPHAKETIKGIESWLVGEHRFTYDGTETVMRVHAIKALAQPVGAFFAWGLNERGEWARAESDFTDATIAVLDSGFNTLDLLTVRNGQIEKRFTGGENLGVRVAAQQVAQALKARYGFRDSMQEADEFIRRYLRDGKATETIAGQKVDLRPIVRQSLNSLATRTIDFITDTWKENITRFSYVLLTGGGALVLQDALRRRIPHAEMLPQPVFANAVGLAKLVQRPSVFKGLRA